MDFPKDPAPTREEMIETYLQTLAKVVGRSFPIFSMPISYFLYAYKFYV